MLQLIQRHSLAFRLSLLSFVTLYLELAFIRFTSAEVLYLGYFSNFILIAVFLGIGLGFLMSEKRFSVFGFVPQILLLSIAFVLLTHIDATYLRENLGQLFFGHPATPLRLPLWLSLGLLFGFSATIFAGLGQETARCFSAFRPIVAYSLDIGGSLAGIFVFTLHSYMGASPSSWFAVAFLLIAVLSYRHSVLNAVVMGLGAILLVVAAAPAHYTEWSPYQRIEVWPLEHRGQVLGYDLAANGIGHQTMLPVGLKEPVYDFPFTEIVEWRGGKGYDDVLIIGAGAGTDVSYALHYGAKSVDAVEIDPVIHKAGVRLHPAHPYADHRVSTFIDDGRAFLERSRKNYDLIIFALPDSLASLSNFGNIRLESFLFTIQSFQQASKRLKPDGVLVLYNYYRRVLEDLRQHARQLTEVFKHSPVVRAYSDDTSIDERRNMLAALAIGPRLAGEERGRSAVVPATDNWPFLYMLAPHLPPMYLGIMVLFVACG
ncbi:hypothetical protein ACFL59_09680, partial [Planctomycetota bacterium]